MLPSVVLMLWRRHGGRGSRTSGYPLTDASLRCSEQRVGATPLNRCAIARCGAAEHMTKAEIVVAGGSPCLEDRGVVNLIRDRSCPWVRRPSARCASG